MNLIAENKENESNPTLCGPHYSLVRVAWKKPRESFQTETYADRRENFVRAACVLTNPNLLQAPQFLQGAGRIPVYAGRTKYYFLPDSQIFAGFPSKTVWIASQAVQDVLNRGEAAGERHLDFYFSSTIVLWIFLSHGTLKAWIGRRIEGASRKKIETKEEIGLFFSQL